METITINKAQLQAAFLQWGMDTRAGKTRPQAEVDALPVEQVAEESAEYLWNELQPKQQLDLCSETPLTGGTCEPSRPEGCESCQ